MKSEMTAELTAALAKAQGAMQNATFNRVNPHFRAKYADLASVIDTVRKPLADNGLAWTQTTEIRNTGPVLVTTLMHTSGQWLSSEYPLPTGVKPQEYGSALTYGRRYSLSAICGIAADEDDDANAAQAANGGPAIDRDQVLELLELIKDVGGDNAEKLQKLTAGLLKYFKIATLPELPAARYKDAIAALENKRGKV